MAEAKRLLREKVLSLRAAMNRDERTMYSQKIQGLVTQTPEFLEANTIMLFLNFRDEIETTELTQQVLDLGKRLVLPRCAPKGMLILSQIRDLEKDIEPGRWGIREPKLEGLTRVLPEEIDCIVVPGVAFDRQGNRLGYGGGYYDRLFERVRETTPKIALAFHCQIVESIPVEVYDKKIDALITERGIMRFD
ncbi:5-formyltetrahydrofolate cyclo-ligase [Desulfitobacterium dichloroeliminans LMG P-21439]|uniref:5-formyltetrahydrofolate cyclo-ligase n=1 Tax=Desulfitobacterium dichloroeliminans (strain LMG P-21439 / DCA1) TaxID=871963 RepID=L0F4C7_DESDL|nr:5-formyltetrahydrofolate cyclo-ligase [Desulfitobacterium dichloroeliminans]AGA68694.1 5-formyltetrahydrofolate cyclo-ligase [Desulfitobacterium dichloroeliminans LMG P-21439]